MEKSIFLRWLGALAVASAVIFLILQVQADSEPNLGLTTCMEILSELPTTSAPLKERMEFQFRSMECRKILLQGGFY
jgi:hypothetical protein